MLKLVWEGNPDGVSRGGCRIRAGHPGSKQSGPRCPTDSKDRCRRGRADSRALAAGRGAAILTTP
ncbi:hypothetical protein AMK31_16920 [Streptomyces sp. TSRI0107]|nr:hypothetical protein AMK31_16920 [Streptomyces sp. TSRI0107]